jgi:hypothetical protein
MTKLEVAVMPTAYRFKRGNRIRIDLANGDSALTEFGWFHHEYTPDKRGQDTIFHGVRQGMASRERDKCRRLAIEVGIGGHKERLSALLNQRRERGPEVAFHRGFSENNFNAKRGCRDLRVRRGLLSSRETRVHEQTDHGRAGKQLVQHLRRRSPGPLLPCHLRPPLVRLL